jgi:hypothetical protein
VKEQELGDYDYVIAFFPFCWAQLLLDAYCRSCILSSGDSASVCLLYMLVRVDVEKRNGARRD